MCSNTHNMLYPLSNKKYMTLKRARDTKNESATRILCTYTHISKAVCRIMSAFNTLKRWCNILLKRNVNVYHLLHKVGRWLLTKTHIYIYKYITIIYKINHGKLQYLRILCSLRKQIKHKLQVVKLKTKQWLNYNQWYIW